MAAGGSYSEKSEKQDATVDYVVPADAWSDVYSALYTPMVRLAGLLVCDYQLGEEIAQDAFARLVEAGEKVTDAPAYLRGTIANLCRSRIRRVVMARRVGSSPSFAESPDRREAGSRQGEAEAVADRVSIRSALRRLSPRQREAVVLRYFADLSEAEVAQVMGVSAGSVKTHLHRARAALGSMLGSSSEEDT